ncbi:MAG: hypothetical protein WKG01_18535 [Kofleriaceae bacterium]
MARRDEDRASPDAELVAARPVAEGNGDRAVRICIQVQSSSVDARPRDHAAGQIRDDACQRLPTGREYQPYEVVATRSDGEGRRGRFVSFRRCCDRPLPSLEIDRCGPIARGLDDHDFTIRRSAPHQRVSEWTSAVSDGNDDVRRRITRHGERSGHAGTELAVGRGGRLARSLVMLVELGAEEKQTDDHDDDCDSFVHDNDSQRCGSGGCGAWFDGEWCENGDDGLARLALFRMKTAAQFIERDL